MKRKGIRLSIAMMAFVASCESAFAYSPSLVVEHDWTIYVGDYGFGLIEYAPIVEPPGLHIVKGGVIRPRTTSMCFGPWSTDVEGHSAPALAAGMAVFIAMVAIAFALLRRSARNSGDDGGIP